MYNFTFYHYCLNEQRTEKYNVPSPYHTFIYELRTQFLHFRRPTFQHQRPIFPHEHVWFPQRQRRRRRIKYKLHGGRSAFLPGKRLNKKKENNVSGDRIGNVRQP